jgi:hypothetical protein
MKSGHNHGARKIRNVQGYTLALKSMRTLFSTLPKPLIQAAEKRILPESTGISSLPIDFACLSAKCITNGSRVEL